MEGYFADLPITQKEGDRFQRFAFSKRIAETIINRTSTDCFTIGIYGAWGEGKTTILNFIENNLTYEKSIIICKFNPWHFKDESTLLLSFFTLLANQLQKSLKTKAEKIGELVSGYATSVIPSLSIFGGVIGVSPGEAIKKAAEKISTLDIEAQKKRIEKILLEEKSKHSANPITERSTFSIDEGADQRICLRSLYH